MGRLPESNVFIPMGDGVRLAATLYLPETPGPWPAILEAYPYRKDDVSVWPDDYRRLRDEGDYAVCRVDTRGTGTSDGVAVDEYPATEADDLCAVIAWLAEQPWCTGAVGMFGSSYAGFATLHAAMLGPPALRAIVPLYATDDRYTDDIHYGGGIRKAIEFNYPLSMVALNALPPVPALAGDRLARAVAGGGSTSSCPGTARSRSRTTGRSGARDRSGPTYDLIRVPTMVIGGWSDLYRNAALRLIEHLDVPKRLLMGPWSHMNPIDSIPGPRIDHVRELIRWFDRWLRGTQNGIDLEPPIVLFVRRTTPPEPDLDAFLGEWRHRAGVAAGPRPAARARAGSRRRSCARRRSPCVATSASWGTSAARTTRPTGSRSTSGRTRSTRSSTTGRCRTISRSWAGPSLELTVRSSQPVAFAAARLSRGAPRRHVGAREPRDPEPHPSRLAHRPRAASRRARPTPCGSSSTPRRGSSRPETASASRSPGPAGPTPGRRRPRRS